MSGTRLMFINFGERKWRIVCLLLPKPVRTALLLRYILMQQNEKQMNYANNCNVHYVAIAGENEINENKITLKNMLTGEQRLVDADELVSIVKSGQ